MRISVVVDDDLMKQVLQASGCKTKKEAIERGLRLLIELHQQKRIKAFRGKLRWTK